MSNLSSFIPVIRFDVDSTDITDSTSIGRLLMTATTEENARTAIGAQQKLTMVTQGAAETGTATTLTGWSAQRVRQNVSAYTHSKEVIDKKQERLDSSKTTDFTAEANKAYWLRETFEVTLPDTTAMPIGTTVTFAKALEAVPNISTGVGGALIQTPGGSDNTVIFDINAEITFVFNGTDWEV